MRTINLKVSDQTAERFFNMTKKEREEIREAVNGLIDDKRTLFEIMDNMTEQAQKKGLTPEILANILEIDMDEMNRILGVEK